MVAESSSVLDGRFVALDGAYNVRDAGDYPTADGRRVVGGRVYRADSLAHLSESDCRRLVETVGIVTVIDLRVEQEIEQAGTNRLGPFGVTTLVRPLLAARGEAANPLEENRPLDLAERYLHYLSSGADHVVAALEAVAAAADRPLVYHCAVGKDRTGVVTALLLSLLGVSDDVIVADYALTSRAMPSIIERLERSELYSKALSRAPRELFMAQPDNMRRFLAGVRGEYGSVEDWARGAGLSDDVVAELRGQLLT